MNSSFDRNLSTEDLLRRRASLLQRVHVDGILLLLLLVLATGSLFILYSASGKNVELLIKQASSFGVGLVGMFIIAQFEPRFMARWVPLAYLAGVYLARRSLPPRFKHILVSMALIVIPFVLILLQPDLGTSLLIITSGFFVLFMAGLQWRWIIGAAAAVVPIAIGMWFFVLREYQKQRVLTFLNPESDPLGSGWNIIQSKAAIGSGGVWGKGWLLGTQSHLDFLPESHTDFIIAVLAEEFGLVGVCLLLLVYLLLIARGLVITVQAQTLFGKLLAGALTMTFFVYVFVNIGMVSGLLPVVGVPLPFISYGGTSLITLLAGFGILMSIHTHRKWMTQA
jgi:rod shape determining protein RodA